MIHDIDSISERIEFPVYAVKEDSRKNGCIIIDGKGRSISDGLTMCEAAFIADAINRFVGVACKEFVEDQLSNKIKKDYRRGRAG